MVVAACSWRRAPVVLVWGSRGSAERGRWRRRRRRRGERLLWLGRGGRGGVGEPGGCEASGVGRGVGAAWARAAARGSVVCAGAGWERWGAGRREGCRGRCAPPTLGLSRGQAEMPSASGPEGPGFEPLLPPTGPRAALLCPSHRLGRTQPSAARAALALLLQVALPSARRLFALSLSLSSPSQGRGPRATGRRGVRPLPGLSPTPKA